MPTHRLIEFMRLSTEVSASYTRPIIEAAVLSALLLIVSFRALDHGEAGFASAFAMAGFWTGVLLIVFHRPHAPTRGDLEVIRSGSLICVVATQVLMRLLWHSGALAI